MPILETKNLTGLALDWAVAQADSHRVAFQSGHLYLVDERGWRIAEWKPSVAWAQGGPIIERERITLRVDTRHGNWVAFRQGQGVEARTVGPTALVAAMRCFVASKMGDTVEIPETLI